MSRPRASCSNCGSPVPARAKFCPECGTRIQADGDVSTAVLETPTPETGPVPVTVTSAEPRFFGVTPPMLLFALSVAALSFAVFLVLTSRWIAAALCAAAAILLFLAFAEVARRKPGGAVARASAGALGSVRARAGVAVEAYAARTRAGREVARLRRELMELGGERERKLRQLGDAVYGDDKKGTKALRAELGELDATIQAKETEMQAVVTEARERIDQARLEAQPTELVEVPEPPRPAPDPVPEPTPPPPVPAPVPEPSPTPVPEPYPPPDEATPPEPARIPEPGPLDSGKKRKK